MERRIMVLGPNTKKLQICGSHILNHISRKGYKFDIFLDTITVEDIVVIEFATLMKKETIRNRPDSVLVIGCKNLKRYDDFINEVHAEKLLDSHRLMKEMDYFIYINMVARKISHDLLLNSDESRTLVED